MQTSVANIKQLSGPEKLPRLSRNGPSRAIYNMVKCSRVKLSHYFMLFFHYNVFLRIESL